MEKVSNKEGEKLGISYISIFKGRKRGKLILSECVLLAIANLRLLAGVVAPPSGLRLQAGGLLVTPWGFDFSSALGEKLKDTCESS